MIEIGVIFGIISMFAWGISDFLAARSVKKESVFSVFFWSQMASTLLLFILFRKFDFSGISAKALIFIIITSVVDIVAYLAYYKAFSVGKTSIISPVVSCWAAVTVVLSVILFGEKLSAVQVLGILLAIFGSVFISFKIHEIRGRKIKSKGLGLAVIAMLAWGSQVVFIRALVGELGWFMPTILIKLALIPIAFIYAKASKQGLNLSKKSIVPMIAVGALESIGFLAISYGINSAYASIVAPVSAAFPLVTILLARIFFKETMEGNQKIGAIMIIAGIILLSVA
ncbi:MAG: DMT family transporter [Candidatus Woesearchaeota archaeon]|nr:DMT family transporter [Candidatus Woesearchaeota archaeon]